MTFDLEIFFFSEIQALKSELFANPNPYKFDEVPDFLDNSIESHSIYSTTAYFVNPSNTKISLISSTRMK